MFTLKKKCSGSRRVPGRTRTGVFTVFWLPLMLVALLATGPPAIAGDCPDDDGDGFVVCVGCDSTGQTCGDCDDGDPAIKPGAAEICDTIDQDCDGSPYPVNPDPADGMDNNSDGIYDEGFGSCIYYTDYAPDGIEKCETGGRLICQVPPGSPSEIKPPWGTLTCERGPAENRMWSEESITAGDSCSNNQDDDCDGKTDLNDDGCCEPTERCDGLDNDCDGEVDEDFTFEGEMIGQPCSVGIGSCERTGVIYCVDQSTAGCSTTAGNPRKEGTTYGKSCDDGKDNDCDGYVDNDPYVDENDRGCAGYGQDELCGNGLDDDGDGQVDEGFPTLGEACTEGDGACAATGVLVCSADGLGTECNAEPFTPGNESEAAGTCGDFIDNDCDGLTDAKDADCASAYADLGVTCSLPYTLAKPGFDCTGKHTVTFDGGQADTVKADLLALDINGTVIGVIENVMYGMEAHLASRTNPNDYEVSTKTSANGIRYTVYAPMPILRVTGTKNGIEDVAYCSILPYLEVTEPKGVTISLSEGSDLDVNAYLPLVNVDRLSIMLDGVSILEELGINPQTAFPTVGTALCTNPGDCVFQIEAGCGDSGMVDVEIRDLRVEGLDRNMASTAKNGVGYPDQVNTVSFTVSGLPMGGHIFYIKGTALPLPKTLASYCLLDDLTDTGTASAFGIEITSPDDQEVVASAPVYVEGKTCGGNEVASLKINGKSLDVSIPDHQTCTEGDGMTTAPECVVNFNEPMAERDIEEAAAGTADIGTYLRGSNRIIADASDVNGNRTFNTGTIFALGPVLKPAVATAMSSFAGRSQKFLADEIDNAFVLHLKEEGAQKFLQDTCQGAIDLWEPELEQQLAGLVFGYLPFEPVCSCDLNVPIKLDDAVFTPHADPCSIDMVENQMVIRLHLPDTVLKLGAHDRCDDGADCVFYCSNMDVTAEVHMKDIWFSYTLTEEAMETNVPGCDDYTLTMTITDSDGNNKDAALGTCSNGGAACANDGQCKGPGTCAKGDNEGDACTTNADCAADDKPGNKCVGGEKDCRNCETNDDCPGGACYSPCVGTCNNYEKNDDFDPLTEKSFYVGGVAAICYAIEVVVRFCIDVVATVITAIVNACGGDWDWEFGLFSLAFGEFEFEEDFLEAVSLTSPEAFLCLKDMKLNNDKTEETGVVSVEAGPLDVEIVDGGLTGTFASSFTTLSPDPGVDNSPGASVTQASAPGSPQIGAVGSDISFLVADDVFNQVFAAMKDAGKLETICFQQRKCAGGTNDGKNCNAQCVGGTKDGKSCNDDTDCTGGTCSDVSSQCPGGGSCTDTLAMGDLGLFQNCGTQVLPISQARCYAFNNTDCSTLTDPDAVKRSKLRGYCYGYEGYDCNLSPVSQTLAKSCLNGNYCLSDSDCAVGQCIVRATTTKTEGDYCEEVTKLNYDANDGLLFCGGVSVDPEVVIKKQDTQISTVGTDVALKQMSVAAVLDRAVDGYNGDLKDLPGCNSQQGKDAADCIFVAGCLELDITSDMSIDNVNSGCAANEVGFVFKTTGVTLQDATIGNICGGTGDPGSDADLLEQVFNTYVTKKIEENAEKFNPPKCIPGMDLCGVLLVGSADTKLFGLRTDGACNSLSADPNCADYLGITVPLDSLFP